MYMYAYVGARIRDSIQDISKSPIHILLTSDEVARVVRSGVLLSKVALNSEMFRQRQSRITSNFVFTGGFSNEYVVCFNIS